MRYFLGLVDLEIRLNLYVPSQMILMYDFINCLVKQKMNKFNKTTVNIVI